LNSVEFSIGGPEVGGGGGGQARRGASASDVLKEMQRTGGSMFEKLKVHVRYKDLGFGVQRFRGLPVHVFV
jgi:hypothetical protein